MGMIQKRYPGSVKNFTQGYKELIDKINIYFKTGLDVGFTVAEKLLADKVAKCKTAEDVIKLAIEISGYHKKKTEKQKEKELKVNVPNNAPKQEGEESDSQDSSSSSADEQEEDSNESNL